MRGRTQPRTPRQTPRQVIEPMLDVARRNRWHTIMDALLTLLARWERGRTGEGS